MAGVAPWARVVVVGADGTNVSVILRGEGPPDLSVVEVLARWQLNARRSGAQLRLEEACSELEMLLELAGLRREVGGQPEDGEDRLDLEEGIDR